ncbi:hypothetical protein MIND_01065500 [Mycena indigotica]|uniref:P-loop containing nucleoside triphosphate hydrolase protein n=1 Tax=Mycena indigotica TaxID=2126181 RepID=A0A8H6S9E2_9AGAR|nr:uncharacterized protein MIND_01065500 [Mycena indigotica]KAF7295264.1 hypothetical protein MIND_01065500 [Mycena indigotica]
MAPTRKKRKLNEPNPEQWPSHFQDLYKVFKALNTVLAFVSSRKQMASSFQSIRASVESLLKRPLDLESVAELKSLLPDLVKFAYIPRSEALAHQEPSREPDFRLRDASTHDEHILVLEFVDKSHGKAIQDQSQMLSAPTTLTPAAMKKLIEKRNQRFEQTVNELLLTAAPGEDSVALLQAAARDHLPVQPSHSSTLPISAPSAENRPSVHAVLDEVIQQDWYLDQIVERRSVPAKSAAIGAYWVLLRPVELNTNIPGSLEFALSDGIADALRHSRKITSFYTHQAEALNAINRRKHVIVSTSTATGKSVTYQVPILRFLESDRNSTALLVYPTKVAALAQDQRAALEQLLASCPGLEDVQVATYDGDTPPELRAGIRENASIILTNFDMIHAGILPFEDLWRRFLKNVKVQLLAVDELHYYSGVLGSHVALIVRRLRRVLAALGNRSFICVSCSATLSKPALHMQRIFGFDAAEIQVVDAESAPSGPKEFVIWSPPSNTTTDRPISCISEATTLMAFLMQHGIRVILFCKHRKVCELVMKSLRYELTKAGRYDVLNRVKSYRGGYSQQDRRQIEHDAFTGHLLGIVATNALELGVDIGSLDAVIMLGFPSSVASFRQQAGRAGRRTRDSLAIFVAEALPIDQYYAKHPDRIFDGDVGDLMVELDNKILLERMPSSVPSALIFIPLSPPAMRRPGDAPLRRRFFLFRPADEGDLSGAPPRRQRRMARRPFFLTMVNVGDLGYRYHPHAKFLPFPSKFISIRNIQDDRYMVVDTTVLGRPRLLEEIEVSRAQFEIYEGGVFLHQGRSFIVQDISHDAKRASVVEADINWHTSPRDITNVDAVQTHRIKEIRDSPHRAYYGRVSIQTLVFGFLKIRNGSILDTVALQNEPWEHETTGCWIDVPASVLALLRIKRFKPAAAIHSAQHAIMNQFVLKQVETECKAAEKEFKKKESARKRPARLIFFDPIGTESGASSKAFDNVHELLRSAEHAIAVCACEEGCGECESINSSPQINLLAGIHSGKCKEKNVISSKLGARLILQGILDMPIDPESIAVQTDDERGHDTIVEPPTVGELIGIDVERANT